MKTLVICNGHPNEMEAAAVWRVLKEELNDPQIIFYRIPYEKTLHGYVIKFLKLLYNNPEYFLSKFERYKSSEKKELGRNLITILREDLKAHSPTNNEKVRDLWARIEDIGFRYSFMRLLGLGQATSDIYDYYIPKLIKKNKAEIVVDFHNSEMDTTYPNPFEICVVPFKDEYTLLVENLKDRFPFQSDVAKGYSEILVIEIPSHISKSRLGGYAFNELLFMDDRDYFTEFSLPHHSENRNLIVSQSKEIKKLLLYLKDYSLH